MAAHESQFFEWLPWIGGYADQVPTGDTERLAWLTAQRARPITPEIKSALENGMILTVHLKSNMLKSLRFANMACNQKKLISGGFFQC